MDIVERLRAPVDDGTPIAVCHLLDEAADQIEALSARIAALKGALREIAAHARCMDGEQSAVFRIATRALATTGEGDGG